ncbi:flagellar motor protein MotB [Paenibacillus sp. YYML68]|uniref:flagellar motor protein MotB n=1 Tax=Paenibacillus sp. YYML68 TaxID=2909250 RepID=UPI0024908762|nr:flagellar motor protein MotB [Paenibacillus sp. YYML68]
MSKKKHSEHHEEHVDETWLIPYADLLTLLLALFIILFAASQTDQKKYETIMKGLNSAFTGGTGNFLPSSIVPITNDPNVESKKFDNPTSATPTELVGQSGQSEAEQQMFQKEQADMENLKQKLDQYIAENNLNTQLETQLTHDLLMITIRDNALFASGDAAVKPEAKLLAVAISDMLSQYPNYRIEVAGHTDNVPINSAAFETNWDLSAKRALNFMKILLQNAQIGPERFRSIGYGEYHPIDTNDTAEGRSKNRRVEVSILRSIKAPDMVDAPK